MGGEEGGEMVLNRGRDGGEEGGKIGDGYELVSRNFFQATCFPVELFDYIACSIHSRKNALSYFFVALHLDGQHLREGLLKTCFGWLVWFDFMK